MFRILIAVLVLAGAYHFATSSSGPKQAAASVYAGSDETSVFAQEVHSKSQGKFLFVMFSTSRCGHCAIQREYLKNMVASGDYNLNVMEVDIERYPGIASLYKKSPGVPDNRGFFNGNQIWSMMGRLQDQQTLVQELQRVTDRNKIPF